jgi:hypothetical protein
MMLLHTSASVQHDPMTIFTRGKGILLAQN